MQIERSAIDLSGYLQRLLHEYDFKIRTESKTEMVQKVKKRMK